MLSVYCNFVVLLLHRRLCCCFLFYVFGLVVCASPLGFRFVRIFRVHPIIVCFFVVFATVLYLCSSVALDALFGALCRVRYSGSWLYIMIMLQATFLVVRRA